MCFFQLSSYQNILLIYVPFWLVDYDKCSCSCHKYPLVHGHHRSSINEFDILHFWFPGTCDCYRCSCIRYKLFSIVLPSLTSSLDSFCSIVVSSCSCYIFYTLYSLKDLATRTHLHYQNGSWLQFDGNFMSIGKKCGVYVVVHPVFFISMPHLL